MGKKLGEVMDVFMALIVVMISCVYLQTRQVGTSNMYGFLYIKKLYI